MNKNLSARIISTSVLKKSLDGNGQRPAKGMGRKLFPNPIIFPLGTGCK